TLDQEVDIFAIQKQVVHRQEGRTAMLRQFHKVFPGFKVRVEIPHNGLDLLPYVPVKPVHAMAFDEGNHVILDCGEIFLHEKHSVPAPGAHRRWASESMILPVSGTRCRNERPGNALDAPWFGTRHFNVLNFFVSIYLSAQTCSCPRNTSVI